MTSRRNSIQVNASLKQKIGSVQSQKIFSMDNQRIPGFLLKFHVGRDSRLIYEVQIRFRLHGLEPEFEDLENMICSLNKRRKNNTSLKKQQVLDGIKRNPCKDWNSPQ
jgi:hypothetical protein